MRYISKTSKNVTVSDDGFLVPWNSGQPAIIRLTPDQSQAKKFDASHNFMGVCDNQFISYDGNFRDANGALLFKGPDVEIE